jgi:hypothetical protein
VWADRFEGDLDDVFELQDRITQDIVAALEVRLTFGDKVRVWRKCSGSPLVYERFLKGRTLYVNFAKHTHAQARSEFERALAINPVYTPALCDEAYVTLGYTRRFNVATTMPWLPARRRLPSAPTVRGPITWQVCFTAILAISGNPPSTNSRRNDLARLAATRVWWMRRGRGFTSVTLWRHETSPRAF